MCADKISFFSITPPSTSNDRGVDRKHRAPPLAGRGARARNSHVKPYFTASFNAFAARNLAVREAAM